VRAVSTDKLQTLPAEVVPREVKPVAKDALTQAIEAFPAQLAEVIKAIPAPVIAPRPAGTWVIDIKRDSKGAMDKMLASFHETKNLTANK